MFASSRATCREAAAHVASQAGIPSYAAASVTRSCFIHSAEHQRQLDVISRNIRDSELARLLPMGVAFYAADLCHDDQRIVEQLLSARGLSVVVSTSSLSVGVNFPVRTVIVMGTTAYRGKAVGNVELPRSQILQCLGRAGRPQFDDKGVAVIMTDKGSAFKYAALAHGEVERIDSHLDVLLGESLNSEIVLQSVTSSTWCCCVSRTFLR